jgi:hypothetical protein
MRLRDAAARCRSSGDDGEGRDTMATTAPPATRPGSSRVDTILALIDAALAEYDAAGPPAARPEPVVLAPLGALRA